MSVTQRLRELDNRTFGPHRAPRPAWVVVGVVYSLGAFAVAGLAQFSGRVADAGTNIGTWTLAALVATPLVAVLQRRWRWDLIRTYAVAGLFSLLARNVEADWAAVLGGVAWGAMTGVALNELRLLLRARKTVAASR